MSINNVYKEKLNFSLFSIGIFISIFGSTIYTFAMGLYVLKLTNSGMNFAITLMSGVVATIIFNPLAGVVADRFNKKKLIIAMDLANGVMFFFLFYLSKYYGLSLGVIYGSTFITTGLTTIFGIAFETSKPNLVTKDNLLRINAVDKIINSAATIGGPAIGGMIFAFVSIELFIVVNGISFVISAILESMIDFNFNKKNTDVEKSSFRFLRDLKTGVNYITSSKDLKNTIGLMTAMNFFISISITVPLPYIINQVLELDPNIYGIVESFFPVGMIVGAGVIKYIMKKFEYKRLLRFTTLILAIIMVAIGLPLFRGFIIFNYIEFLIYYCTVMFLLGLTISFIDIPIMYYLQTKVPSELRGRVISIGIAGAKIIAPIGLLLSGILLEQITAYMLPVFGGIVLFVGTLFYMNVQNESRNAINKDTISIAKSVDE